MEQKGVCRGLLTQQKNKQLQFFVFVKNTKILHSPITLITPAP